MTNRSPKIALKVIKLYTICEHIVNTIVNFVNDPKPWFSQSNKCVYNAFTLV